MNRRVFLVSLALAAGAGGLALLNLTPSGAIPRLEIHLGHERCNRCGMIISRINYAAAFYVESKGDWKKYDDIGCMIKDYIDIKDDAKVLAVKVFDFDAGEELEANEAYYILASLKKLRTPMGYNILAFREQSMAELHAKEHESKVLIWSDALRSVPGGGL
jgi:copper chaperone NosL